MRCWNASRKLILRNLLVGVTCAWTALTVHAEPVNSTRAARAARGWYKVRFPVVEESGPGEPTPLAAITPEAARPIVARGRTVAFAFDIPGEGCIAIAAEDELAPVFYYSLKHRLMEPGVPPAREIKEALGGKIAQLQDNKNRTIAEAHPLWAVLTTLGDTKNDIGLLSAFPSSPKGPLLTSTWGQDRPYNEKCPMYQGQRCMVGCVATAMAQIMRYWQHPESGTGKHCYYWALAKIAPCADFGSTTYDWENMPEVATPFATRAVREAVSTLSYHCGVAVDTDYSPSWSGAWHYNAAVAFSKYFGYEPTQFVGQMGGVTVDEWYEIMREEINREQPVLYSSVDHAFVLDGYDVPDLVHLNFGLDGHEDGWYSIDSFSSDPLNSRYVHAVINIRPHRCEITDVARASGDCPQIRWKSLPKSNYAVWSCTDLQSGLWVKEADVCSEGMATCWMDPFPLEGAKFYRIEKKP